MNDRRKRVWVKIHCDGMLHGSINFQLSEQEQCIWVKLICLAGFIGRDGQISDNDGRPFPHHFIAHELHTDGALLEGTLIKCKAEGRLSEDDAGLHITNWSVYQSEYDRTKKYRQKEDDSPEKYSKGKYQSKVQK